MTLQETCALIAQLREENKSNSPEERRFNKDWIALLKKAMTTAVDKAYK